jgi:hypothetical protein
MKKQLGYLNAKIGIKIEKSKELSVTLKKTTDKNCLKLLLLIEPNSKWKTIYNKR